MTLQFVLKILKTIVNIYVHTMKMMTIIFSILSANCHIIYVSCIAICKRINIYVCVFILLQIVHIIYVACIAICKRTLT